MDSQTNQNIQLLIESPIPKTPNFTLTLNSNQTFGDLIKTLTPFNSPSSSSSFFLSLNGKIQNESTTIRNSKITPLSTLNLHFRVVGGGGDGGATGAESRDCYLNMYAEKKPDKVDPNEKRLSKWMTCALSFEPLKPPCVIDFLGNVFNKEVVVKALLAKSLPKPYSLYIKGLKDLIPIQLTRSKKSEDVDVKFECPISGLEFNGKYKFYALRKCGHVLSGKALREVKSLYCLVCQAEFEEDDRVVINGSEEEVEVLREKMVRMKEVEREKKGGCVKVKKAKAKAKLTSEQLDDDGCGGVQLSGRKHGVEEEEEGNGNEKGAAVASAGVDVGVVPSAKKRFKAVDVAPPNANKQVYASLFTSSKKKSDFRETYSCRSLPLGRN